MLIYIMILLLMHFLADFVCQTSWMAENKSINEDALLSHVVVYTLIISIGFIIPLGFWLGICATLINGFIHYTCDAFTCQLTSYYWKKKETHNFFVVVGFDQLIHQICLICSLFLFL